MLLLSDLGAVYIALPTSTVFKTVEQKSLLACVYCSAITEISRESLFSEEERLRGAVVVCLPEP